MPIVDLHDYLVDGPDPALVAVAGSDSGRRAISPQVWWLSSPWVSSTSWKDSFEEATGSEGIEAHQVAIHSEARSGMLVAYFTRCI